MSVRSLCLVGLTAGLLGACGGSSSNGGDANGGDAGTRADAVADAKADTAQVVDTRSPDTDAPATDTTLDTPSTSTNDGGAGDATDTADGRAGDVADAAGEVAKDVAADVSGNVTDAAPDAATAGRASDQRPTRSGLEYHGAIAIYRPATLPFAPGGKRSSRSSTASPHLRAAGEWLEISAPIWPKVLTLYQGEGANYPATAQGRLDLARASALTFETLLTTCQSKYPELVLASPGGPALTEAQLGMNFAVLQNCAYEQYTAKPYWIPQLLLDVDICEDQLGSEWRLITEADLRGLSADDFAVIQSTLESVGGTRGFYFSGSVFTRLDDGTIARGNLDPATSPRISPLVSLNGLPYDPKVHNEGGVGLRCMRITIE